ncbi:MAG TPA: molybdate ABC transporter substrate-binding protein [Polyangiaceae bacterium]
MLRSAFRNRRSDATRILAIGLLVVLGLTTSSCQRRRSAAPAEHELIVFAAASLRDAFAPLSDGWKQLHPGVTVTFSFAGTQELRTQIEEGANVDVFASADQRHMDALLKAGRVKPAVVFTRNEPVVVLSNHSSASIREFRELPNVERIIVGVPEVPIGRYTLQILERSRGHWGDDFAARVNAKILSRELNVRQILAKVVLGEADAGIVYRTDALSATGRVRVIPIPVDVNVVADYPIAELTHARHSSLAHTFIEYVTSPAGQAILKRSGFASPRTSLAFQ